MTRDEAEAKIKALWPQHEITGLPMSASGVLKILEALDLISFKDKPAKNDGVALKAIAHPEGGEAVAEDADINPDAVETVELTEEQVENLKKSAPLKVAKKSAKKVAIEE